MMADRDLLGGFHFTFGPLHCVFFCVASHPQIFSELRETVFHRRPSDLQLST